jgi:hypothetical protein
VEGILPGTRASRHMTTSQKAFALYGPLAAGMLICAGLAALGSFRAFPVLAGTARKVCLVGAAVAMAVQGAAMRPRKWESRLVIKPHVLAAGSLMLFAGAALPVVLLFAGCGQAAAKVQRVALLDFKIANEQFRGAWFALPHLGALERNCCRENARDKNRPLARGCDPRACGSASRLCALKTALASVRRAELTVAVSGRQDSDLVK